MGGKSAKSALSKTSPLADKAKSHLIKSGNPLFFMRRVNTPHIGKGINRIHFFHCKRRRWRVLNQKPGTLILNQLFSAQGVLLQRKEAERLGKSSFIPAYGIKRRKFYGIRSILTNVCLPASAAYISNGGDGNAFREHPGDGFQRFFRHTVNQKIRSGIDQKRTPHIIGPIVVMRNAPKARLNPSNNKRNVLPEFAHSVAINERGPIRTHPPLPSGGITIAAPFFPGSRKMI